MKDRAIQIENIRKVYREGSVEVVAVDDVTMAVERGEVAAIMGPSGSGKTTLLSIMGCILRPTRGTIRILDEDVTELRERELPRVRLENIGFIFQSFNLFPALTARENIEAALTLKGVRGSVGVREALRLLDIVALGRRADFLPRDLSGGEKQRVSIARALANRPPIILADEPTGNLDSKTGHEIMSLLRRLAHEDRTAVVVVTHDHRISDLADRIVTLEDGRIIRTADTASEAVS